MQLLKKLNSFHANYDKMKEPWRFLMFLVPSVILVLVASSPIVPFKVIGIFGLTAMFVTRFVYLKTDTSDNVNIRVNQVKETKIKKD
jgi:hypothetical protein